MRKNKIIALVLSFSLTLGLVPSVATYAAVKENSTTIAVQATDEVVPTKPNSNVQTSGVKGKIAKATLKAAAKTFRSSGLKSTLNALKYLGFSTKTVNNMVKYSDDVADVLDELSRVSDVVKMTIYEKIAGALGGGTVANDVAWWTATLIDWGFL